uniref:Uncharacterized protein n=1 Tax=Anopheles atroparvus TaxID=41427 RepID=A0A182J991_ANOAO
MMLKAVVDTEANPTILRSMMPMRGMKDLSALICLMETSRRTGIQAMTDEAPLIRLGLLMHCLAPVEWMAYSTSCIQNMVANGYADVSGATRTWTPAPTNSTGTQIGTHADASNLYWRTLSQYSRLISGSATTSDRIMDGEQQLVPTERVKFIPVKMSWRDVVEASFPVTEAFYIGNTYRATYDDPKWMDHWYGGVVPWWFVQAVLLKFGGQLTVKTNSPVSVKLNVEEDWLDEVGYHLKANDAFATDLSILTSSIMYEKKVQRKSSPYFTILTPTKDAHEMKVHWTSWYYNFINDLPKSGLRRRIKVSPPDFDGIVELNTMVFPDSRRFKGYANPEAFVDGTQLSSDYCYAVYGGGCSVTHKVCGDSQEVVWSEGQILCQWLVRKSPERRLSPISSWGDGGGESLQGKGKKSPERRLSSPIPSSRYREMAPMRRGRSPELARDERRRSHEALKESERRVREVMRSKPVDRDRSRSPGSPCQRVVRERERSYERSPTCMSYMKGAR